MSNVTLLAVVASAVFLIRLLPQPLRLARTGVAEGVSPLAALNAAVSALAWIAYGLAAHLPVVWGVSVLALVPGVWQVLLLRREVTTVDVAWAAGFVGLLVVAAAAGVLGAALAATVLLTSGPQVVRSLRERDLSGLAPATWWVALVDATTWGAYGYAIGDGALIGYFVVLFASASIVLVRIAATRDAGSAVADEVSVDAAIG